MADKENINDARKMEYDSFKHLTTLCTGTLLLLAGFLDKLFSDPQWLALVTAVFICLMLSIASSVILMFVTSMEIRENVGWDEKHPSCVGWLHFFSSGGFVIALIIFSVFFVKNYG